MSHKKELTAKDKKKIAVKDPAYLQLTPMQEKFCYEYIVDRVRIQAAIRAGFSKKTAYTSATKLFKNPYVQYKINRLIEEQNAKLEITAANVLGEMKKLAYFDIQDIYNEDGSIKRVQDMPETVRKCIAAVEVEAIFIGKGKLRTQIGTVTKLKFWPKDKMLEMLGKYTKVLSDAPLIAPGSVLVFGDITIEDIKKQDAPTLLDNINNRLAQQYQKQ
jgi:phage terminase small subunit